MLPELLLSMVVENDFGAELLSGCVILSTWSEISSMFCVVLNMLDFIILGQ